MVGFGIKFTLLKLPKNCGFGEYRDGEYRDGHEKMHIYLIISMI
jgi:hypothetical protein